MTFYRMTDAGREERPTLSLFPTGQFMTPVLYSQSEATLQSTETTRRSAARNACPTVRFRRAKPSRSECGEATPLTLTCHRYPRSGYL